MKTFKGKVALITGASSGIGEALALALAREGATLVLVGRDLERLDAVRRRCVEAGAEAWTQTADVSDAAQVQALADAVHRRYPALDLLINNAGVVMAGLLAEVPAADWQRLFDINVMGVVHGCRAFVPRMAERGQGGSVVNIASVAGLVGQRGMSTYCASKFAVVGLSECLRAEMHRHGIGVTVIAPGYVQTPIATKVKMVGSFDNERMRARVTAQFQNNQLSPEAVARRTLRAIRRRESLVTIGRDAKLAGFFRRWAPGLLARYQRGGSQPRRAS